MTTRVPVRVVWFKRDLRVADHRALVAAASSGDAVVCLYVYEPEYWRLPDVEVRHLTAINQSLKELRGSLRDLGGELVLRVGDVVDALEELSGGFEIRSLHSHEETGNGWTFERDKRVAGWCRRSGVDWVEEVQNGVQRPNPDRDGWSRRWNARMREPLVEAPERIQTASVRPVGRFATPKRMGLPENAIARRQQPTGEAIGRELLDSFLDRRGVRYHKEMSSPVTAFDACSRMSVHLAYGNLSMRQVFQAHAERQAEVREQKKAGEDTGTWGAAMTAFGARLRWHCHFMQKLEDEPELEWHNLSRAYDSLRDEVPDAERLAAWKEGRTGYPMVDACMRCVAATGYLNFRMRAMVVSFASYHLWLHWREPSLHLARMFTDYEPGIHYSQFQMQSGTTGINTVRIYSPIKQVSDQDPTGVFIRQWVPELKDVPDKMLPTPEKIDGGVAGYPPPVVDHKTAYAEARSRVMQLRRTERAREEAAGVLQKHGSRKRPPRRQR